MVHSVSQRMILLSLGCSVMESPCQQHFCHHHDMEERWLNCALVLEVSELPHGSYFSYSSLDSAGHMVTSNSKGVGGNIILVCTHRENHNSGIIAGNRLSQTRGSTYTEGLYFLIAVEKGGHFFLSFIRQF